MLLGLDLCVTRFFVSECDVLAWRSFQRKFQTFVSFLRRTSVASLFPCGAEKILRDGRGLPKAFWAYPLYVLMVRWGMLSGVLLRRGISLWSPPFVVSAAWRCRAAEGTFFSKRTAKLRILLAIRCLHVIIFCFFLCVWFFPFCESLVCCAILRRRVVSGPALLPRAIACPRFV